MNYQLPDGALLYYEYYQQHTHYPNLVFLNGLSQSTLVWKPFVEAFKHTHNVLLLDLVFQGNSTKEARYRTFEQHAADVNSLFELLGLERITVVGISYGGAVAQRLMYLFAQRLVGAVLVSTFAHKTPYFNFIGEGWKNALKAGGYSLMLDVMLPAVLGKIYFENPVIPIETFRAMRSSLNDNPDALLKLMRATEESTDYRPNLQKVQLPTLVVQGEHDILTTPEIGLAIANALPNSRFIVLPKVGHSLNIEAVTALTEHISTFLKSLA